MTKTLLKLALTCAALWLALHNISWEEFKDAYQRQLPAPFWAAVLLLMLQNIAGGMRWHHVRVALSGHEGQNATRTTLLYYASNFFNVFLPSTMGGDIARVVMVKNDSGTKDALYGVIVDRLLSLVGLGLLVFATLPWLAPYFGMSETTGLVATTICYAFVLAGYTVLRLLLPLLQELLPYRFLSDIFAALQRVVDKYGPLLCALLWSAAAHIAYASAAYALARSLGVDIGWLACLVLVPLVLFISAMPITLGGWGLRELGMKGLLALAGVSSAPAVLIAVQLGLLSTLISLMGGLIYLFMKKKSRD